MRLDLTGWTVGVELEGTALCADRGGTPVEVAGLVREAGEQGNLIGLTGEVGLHQFELHCGGFPLLASEGSLGWWEGHVRNFFPRRGVVPVFSSVSPLWTPEHGAPTVPVESLPRCAAILAAIDKMTKEPGRGLALFGQTAGHNALQFHLRPPGYESKDFFGPLGVAVVNAFACQGLAPWFEAEHLSDAGARVHNHYNREGFWSLAPGRGPTDGPYTVESLIERWMRIPRLVRHEGDEWLVDLGLPTLEEVCRTGLYGTVWERVRPSPERSDKPATIEVRLWGAVRPEAVVWVLQNQIIPTLESIRL